MKRLLMTIYSSVQHITYKTSDLTYKLGPLLGSLGITDHDKFKWQKNNKMSKFILKWRLKKALNGYKVFLS